MPPDGTKNLKPQSTRTKDEQKRIAKLGGLKSGEARREKKRLSQIYSSFFAKKFNVGGASMTGEELSETVVLAVLMRQDKLSVEMLKEMREATEGNKISFNGTIAPVDTSKLSKGQQEVLLDVLSSVLGNDAKNTD